MCLHCRIWHTTYANEKYIVIKLITYDCHCAERVCAYDVASSIANLLFIAMLKFFRCLEIRSLKHDLLLTIYFCCLSLFFSVKLIFRLSWHTLNGVDRKQWQRKVKKKFKINYRELFWGYTSSWEVCMYFVHMNTLMNIQ